MSRLRRFDIVEHHLLHHQLSPPYFLQQTSIFDSLLEPHFHLDFHAASDLIQIHRVSARRPLPDLYLQALSDRVSALELGFKRLSKEEDAREKKYTWTAEIKTPGDERKYKWTAEKNGLSRSYKVTTEIKRRGAAEQTYTFKVSSGDEKKVEEKKEKKKKVKCEKAKEKGKLAGVRIVEIEEPSHHGGIVLRQVGIFLLAYFYYFLFDSANLHQYCE